MRRESLKCDELVAEQWLDYSGEPNRCYPADKVDEAVAELKDKCEMHDFFWEGCGFARRGFKNTIAVSEAFDRLEAEIARLNGILNVWNTYRVLGGTYKKLDKRNYKYCMAMADAYHLRMMLACDYPESALFKNACRRHRKYLELAEKFKAK